MNKKQTRASMGDGRIATTVVLTSLPCLPGSSASVQEQINMLETLVQNKQLMMTGHVLFETMEMIHDGEAWVVTLRGHDVNA